MINQELLEKYTDMINGNNSNAVYISNHIKKDGTKISHENIELDDEKIPADTYINRLKETNYTEIHFVNCQFNSDINIFQEYSSIILKNCTCKGKFYINNQYSNQNQIMNIDTINIQDTKFEQNSKLHNTKVKNFTFKDTDFEKNADFFKTHFEVTQDILFHIINFRALALFGELVFDRYVEFKYVTFAGYSHFRSATFKKGLNLEYANIEKEMNFFDIKELYKKLSQTKTSQETYRIVKHHLQKVGNIIYSNKYHALELQKKKGQVCSYGDKENRSLLDCIVLSIHKVTSDYSTNWFYALVWILAVGLLTSYVVYDGLIVVEFYKYSSLLTSIDDFCGIYWLFILNKIALGYLYYQFVMAVRKDKRK
jgi:hypothetical protein